MRSTNDSLHRQSRMSKHTGWIVSLVTLPFGTLMASMSCLQCWNIFREIYCRVYHESAVLLCQFVDWDFRVDAMIVFAGSIVFYVIFHLRDVRRMTLRNCLLIQAGLFCSCILLILAHSQVPGEWEAWSQTAHIQKNGALVRD